MTSIPERLRQIVINRANGCCEYCLSPQDDFLFSHEVDHIIAEKHRGTTTEDNLCLSCMRCNRHKGSDFGSFDPDTGQITLLFNPRKDQWNEHFKLVDVMIEPLTAIGRVSVFLLQFNSEERLEERHLWIDLGMYPCRRR